MLRIQNLGKIGNDSPTCRPDRVCNSVSRPAAGPFARAEPGLERAARFVPCTGIRRVRLKATHGEWSLAVQILPGRYPGIALVWFPSDWSSYAELSFDLTFEGPGELDLIVKIQDRQHNNQHEDRFHQSFRLQSSQHHIRIDLGQVAVAPKGRLPDLTQVTFLQLFVVNIDRLQIFYLDHVRLHKNGQKIAKDVMGKRE